MNLKTLLLTKNSCFIAGKTITPKGVMLHSTGANNPDLKRYVGPNDGLLGEDKYSNHWNQPTPDGKQVCPHAFIGKLADGSIAAYQTLPWNYRGWHCGGEGNNTHISVEICEDGLTNADYFNKVYQEAVELFAYLCKIYNLDPTKDGVVICHSEGYKRGIASNHSDVMHWFPRHGKSMNTFRTAVKVKLSAVDSGNLAAAGGLVEGTLVEINAGTANYYPGSTSIPSWVISDYYHKITQVTSGGKTVTKGGKECVLLGKKVKKSGGSEEAGINTWISKDALRIVSGSYEQYTVKSGDTLWAIAASKLGNGARYPEIKTLNGLTNDTIKTGQVLKIPSK